MKRKSFAHPGFTIVELLVVTVVIGILAAISIVSYVGISSKAIAISLQSDLSNASIQLKVYQVGNSNGDYPTSTDCSNSPIANSICLKASPGNSFGSSYMSNNSTSPKTFTLTATNRSISYVITNDSIPTLSVSTPPEVIGEIGTGADGTVTISAAKNISTDILGSSRTCADAINYSITNLTNNTASLAANPVDGCLAVGDEMLLINLQGTSANYVNVGNYETLRIQSITTNVITFTTNKIKYYGNGISDDTNLGVATTNQRVMLQRIPNYTSVFVNSGVTLTANAWDGIKGGVLFLRANNSLAIDGIVSMTGKGYRGGVGNVYAGAAGGGESYNGAGGVGGGNGDSASRNGASGQGGGGGGGAYSSSFGTSATGSVGTGGGGGGGSGYYANNEPGGGGGGGGYGMIGNGGNAGGSIANSGSGINGGNGKTSAVGRYGGGGGGGGGDGLADSSGLAMRAYMGGAGAAGGGGFGGTVIVSGANGGSSGGIIIIAAKQLSINSGGSITSGGSNGAIPTNTYQGGGGAGGSIVFSAINTLTNVGTIAANGGLGSSTILSGGIGGAGRIYIQSNSQNGSGTISPSPYNT